MLWWLYETRTMGHARMNLRSVALWLSYLVTACSNTAEVLPLNEVLPPYTAVIESVPTGKLVVVYLDIPPTRLNAPSVTFPFLNVTVPVGVPLNSGLIVAVKVTDLP